MIGKEYRQIITLFIFLIVLDVFTRVSAAEKQKGLVRRKRNIICLLGLTGFISDIFYGAMKGIQKYDPVQIGSLLDGRLQNGVFKGLSSLRNDSNIKVDCDDELVVLSTSLDVNEASIDYQWKQKLLMTFKGSVGTKVKIIQFSLALTLNMTRGITLDVANLKLTKMDGLRFDFSGLGPMNPLIEVLGSLLMKVWEQKITQTIEELLRDTLESELSKFKISF